jgi:hypothetical protein
VCRRGTNIKSVIWLTGISSYRALLTNSRGAGPVSSVLFGGKDAQSPVLVFLLGLKCKGRGRRGGFRTEIPYSNFYRRLSCSPILRDGYPVKILDSCAFAYAA